ncbi:helix-turn-helix domain-containing protein [Amycolatopsis roodepoortensis]|uniref:Helix-turn-helix domain-containing protein n=1 Tax=Amycolatopsis roodepoortensis TaxID=700274 RepID=A0ABR9L2T0_9PSEU|nr:MULTISPECIES: hypothetical protein [Amycolatopsis]MBE1575073.1 hypothetical protein [Amycolatopsis roodepoortensis]GHG97524.1 hypothetical protein GCM10017788_77090 [Amycolatopsis acidiphila]
MPNDHDPAALAAAYVAGATLGELAGRHGLTYYKARDLVQSAGVTLRHVGPETPPAPPGMAARYEDGATIHEVAAAYGFSFGVTRRMLLAAGVTLRQKGQRL